MLTSITVAGTQYQSYVSVAEADVFLAVEPNRRATWEALSTDDKGRTLIASTRRIDAFEFKGMKADPDQSTKWPRQQGPLDDLPTDGISTGTTIPDAVEEATALLAGTIAIDPSAAGVQHPGTDQQYLKQVQAGSARVEYYPRNRTSSGSSTIPTTTAEAAQLADEEAQLLLSPFILTAQTSRSGFTEEAGGAFAGGTDRQSQSDNPDNDLDRSYAFA